MKASGRTLTVGELQAELAGSHPNTPVYVAIAGEDGSEVSEVYADGMRVEFGFTHDPDPCRDLLWLFFKKEMTAAELCKAAREQFE